MGILFIGMDKTINLVDSMNKLKSLRNQQTFNYHFFLPPILIGSHLISVIFPL